MLRISGIANRFHLFCSADRALAGGRGHPDGSAVDGAQGLGEHNAVLKVRAREGSPGKGESNVQPTGTSTREDRLVTDWCNHGPSPADFEFHTLLVSYHPNRALQKGDARWHSPKLRHTRV
jgi:hypothetical protein